MQSEVTFKWFHTQTSLRNLPAMSYDWCSSMQTFHWEAFRLNLPFLTSETDFYDSLSWSAVSAQTLERLSKCTATWFGLLHCLKTVPAVTVQGPCRAAPVHAALTTEHEWGALSSGFVQPSDHDMGLCIHKVGYLLTTLLWRGKQKQLSLNMLHSVTVTLLITILTL